MNERHIYLTGMKHTGKTQHGRALARALDRPFHDTDALIQELDATEDGMRRLVRDIYLEDGRERFHQLEAAGCRLVSTFDTPVVVATGGGICENPEALHALSGGLFVHIEDSEEALATRIFRGGIPAFLHTNDADEGRERFHLLYEKRMTMYRELADLTVDVRGLELAEAQATIIAAVQEYLSAGK